MNSDPLNQFDLPEPVVADRIGLSLEELKKRRGPEGERWKKRDSGRQVVWSEAGVKDLEAELAKKAAADAAPEPVAARPVEVFTVVRARTARVLHVVRKDTAYDPAHPLCVWLPQPRSWMFRPGMTVLARGRVGRSWVFDYEGNPEQPQKGRRMPRARGKW